MRQNVKAKKIMTFAEWSRSPAGRRAYQRMMRVGEADSEMVAGMRRISMRKWLQAVNI